MPRGDDPKITRFRRNAHARAGKVPEAGKETTRAEGGDRASPSVLDRATPRQVAFAHLPTFADFQGAPE